jgi:hypothetical protein
MRNTTTQTTKDAAVLRELAEGLREEDLTLTARDVDEIAERIDALVEALRDIASVDRDFVEANGGAEDAIDKIIGHARAALDNLKGGNDE